ncbi:peptidoglycan DD-metalloendopeptidase family protein [Rubrimonas cliftonensis]|uniref:Murein DD-endopeptidase MepM and murein hydrolase activator NlpD, contain LysM domain n=1 Tax=Rubrimonas cliftonensis TaxID=89524 RepID=A0A1H4BCR8_9RHOB|nr:peptidoglycan DD-metalloendopeptidase family protein [Rubrimonas cliftonensis]SEA45907.1 Murein DD-endopeptidase MepM and murein hydrolase activator NlpD, contain LysM domain [Rubrimonas cliftonensis]
MKQPPRLPAATQRLFADKTIVIRSGEVGHCMHLGSGAQAATLAAALLLVVWLVAATGLLAAQGLASQGLGAVGLVQADRQADGIAQAYERRIAEIESAAAADAAALTEAEARLDAMAQALARRHDAFAQAATLAARAEAAEAALADAAAARAGAERAAAAAQARLSRVEDDRADLADTLARIAGALEGAAVQRDDATAQAGALSAALAAMQAGQQEARARQAALLGELERAAELSIAPLEDMLEKAGVDVGDILRELRSETAALDGPGPETSGPDASPGASGGPFVPDDVAKDNDTASPAALAPVAGAGVVAPTPRPTPSSDEGAALEIDVRAAALVEDLSRVRLLRAAAQRMPFATPVRGPRFTSGFGGRRDPINGRYARHDGLDMAGPVGTPILSPADGVVTFAGVRRGYGRMIEIRHDFGVGTVYAHLSRQRVKVGQRVVRGERIGDMGSTGRSTGSHLHYEIHVDGRPVDPMTFIKAARHVL